MRMKLMDVWKLPAKSTMFRKSCEGISILSLQPHTLKQTLSAEPNGRSQDLHPRMAEKEDADTL